MATAPPVVVPTAPPPPPDYMAMANCPPQSGIEELVSCPICMERMRNPKHLTCQHAFCAHCLDDWTSQPGNSKRSISCPVCRISTPIKNGVEKLPNDIGVIRLLDMLTQQQQQQQQQQQRMSGGLVVGGVLCGYDGAAAVALCESCGHHLCSNCVQQHIHNQTLWPHLLHLHAVSCVQHDSRVHNLYCQQCNQVGCSLCMQERHARHTITDLPAVSNMNRAAMGYLSQMLRDTMETAREQPDMISVVALERRFEELKQQIDAHANKNQMTVDLWRKSTLTDLKRRSDKLGNEVAGVEAQMEACDGLLSFVDRFLEESSDYQLVTAFSAASQRLHRATDALQHVAKRSRTGDYELAFVSDPVPQSCGTLRNPQEEAHCSPQKDKLYPDLTHSEDVPADVPTKSVQSASCQTMEWEDSAPGTSRQGETRSTGTTSQPRASRRTPPHTAPNTPVMEFDASCWENEGVMTEADLHSGPDKDKSHLAKHISQWVRWEKDEDVEAPVTVFLHNKTGHLYVGKTGWWTAGTVDRFNSCQHLYGIKKVMSKVYPKSIAVSPVDGTIAVCLGDRIDYHVKGVIPAERKNGTVSTSVFTLPTIRAPYGIAISSDNRWVVVDQTHCLIGIYKYNPGVLWDKITHIATFGCDGNGPREFHAPTYVCCDSERDRFFVSDTGNNRIQAFNMAGDYLWEMDGASSGCALSKPRGLCVDGRGNILVADTGNQRLAVFGWERGDWVKSVQLDMMPHSVTVDGRDSHKAEVVIGGLNGKMPVIKTLGFSRPSCSSGAGWWS